MTLTSESLAEVMDHRLPLHGYVRLFPAMNNAMLQAGCTNLNRAAAWCAQIGHESGGLRWMEEIADGSAYEGRRDLGNTQPGDGVKFKGHGPIQITGRHNHTKVSEWAFQQGYTQSPTLFVDQPQLLASAEYGFLGAVWYWTVARSNINAMADAGDIVGVTKAVNGGTHGLDDRKRIYNHALQMGDAILPTGDVPAPPPPNITPRPDWRGDPVFMPDLFASFGIDLHIYPGAFDRGHGDFGSIGWLCWHHTGNENEKPDTIAKHPTLGLAANLHIAPDGIVTLCGVGIAWHAGEGIYPGIPEDGLNPISIGIECAYGPDFRKPWPPAQVESMLRVGAALTWFLGIPPNHNIAHKEWAGADNPLGINKQGKPDPANFNMNWFRDQIAARTATGPTGQGEDELSAEAEKMIRELHAAQADSLSMYAIGPEEKCSQAEAYAWDQRVESSALRGEAWAVIRVKEAAEGTLYGVQRNGRPDPFLVEHAKAVMVELIAAHQSQT